MIDIENIKKQFPSLDQMVHDKPLTYLDSAATTLKPKIVLDTIASYYGKQYSTVRRGLYKLSENTTIAYETCRRHVAKFINAASEKEIVFTSGTTDSINLVAASFGRKFIEKGDEVIVSAIEHHANIVPWQIICEEKGAQLKVIPVNDNGELMIDEYKKLLSDKTKIVAVGHVSNALGTINPIKEMIDLAHEKNIPVLIDGAQSAPHIAIDVQALDCDFYAFSGHKIYGPTGVGVLYGKYEILEKMPPYRSGGDMIETVTFEKTTYQEPPYRFEAGTPPIVEVIALSSALDFLEEVGLDNIHDHESELLAYATEKMLEIKGLQIIGTAKEKTSVISFVMQEAHPHDIGTILDSEGIALRSGHHCAMPIMERFKVPATARVSFGIYNTKEDVDTLIKGLHQINSLFDVD
ncbi:MAG: cysteine desulfurase CsdA [Planctomycetota bacterium]|nr:MAG: cysteine desulfurase CsdA [Planctomycetota bacterium]